MVEATGESPDDPQVEPALAELRCVGLRSLADVSIRLHSRFTLLIGQNGAGKSSVLDAVDMLCEAKTSMSSALFRDDRSLELLRTHGAARLDFGLATPNESFWIGAPGDLYATGAGPRAILRGPPPWLNPAHATSRSSRRSGTPPPMGPSLRDLGPAMKLRLDPGRIAAASIPMSKTPGLDAHGHGLPSTLAWLASNDPDARAAIERDLAEIVPGAGRIRTPRAEVTWIEVENIQVGEDLLPRHKRRTQIGDGLELELAGQGFVPAAALSEGTLLSLAMLTVLHGPSCPQILLIDDIERGLHPDAQLDLVKSIRALLTVKPKLQILATTHSPYLLDAFGPEEVWALALDSAGHSHARSFDQHPRAKELLESFRLGELWGVEGESWILQQTTGEARSA